MFIIALMALKGGVSKTTLAANVACMAWGDAALREYDRRVCLIDLDFAQGSLTAVHRLRGCAGPDLLAIEEFADLPHLIASAERAGYPVCVIDTAGQDTPALSMVADVADLCIVPVGPSELDFLGVLPTLQMLRRKDATFRVVLARTWHSESAATKILRERLQPEGLLFATRIAERVAYKEAIRYGQAVTEFDPACRAGEEMTAFYCEVKEALGGFAA